jgi:hypothetical protein
LFGQFLQVRKASGIYKLPRGLRVESIDPEDDHAPCRSGRRAAPEKQRSQGESEREDEQEEGSEEQRQAEGEERPHEGEPCPWPDVGEYR